MPGVFSAAIFDMDGLLLDSERLIRAVWLEVCAARGVTLTEDDYRGAIGRGARDSRAHMLSVCGPSFDYDAAAANVDEILESRYGQVGYPLKDGALELLSWMREHGVPMAVASSTQHAEVERRLHNAGIRTFFGAVVGGDQVRHGKPAPDLYLLAHERLGRTRADRSLAFEDSEPGAEAAIAAEMGVVVVPDLRPPSASVMARSVAVLMSLRAAIPRCGAWMERT